MKSNSLKTADLSAKTHVFNCVQSVRKFLENTLRSVYTVLIIEGSQKTVLQAAHIPGLARESLRQQDRNFCTIRPQNPTKRRYFHV